MKVGCAAAPLVRVTVLALATVPHSRAPKPMVLFLGLDARELFLVVLMCNGDSALMLECKQLQLEHRDWRAEQLNATQTWPPVPLRASLERDCAQATHAQWYRKNSTLILGDAASPPSPQHRDVVLSSHHFSKRDFSPSAAAPANSKRGSVGDSACAEHTAMPETYLQPSPASNVSLAAAYTHRVLMSTQAEGPHSRALPGNAQRCLDFDATSASQDAPWAGTLAALSLPEVMQHSNGRAQCSQRESVQFSTAAAADFDLSAMLRQTTDELTEGCRFLEEHLASACRGSAMHGSRFDSIQHQTATASTLLTHLAQQAPEDQIDAYLAGLTRTPRLGRKRARHQGSHDKQL